MSEFKLEDNVQKFLEGAVTYYGKSAEERFSQEMFCNCMELGMQSPIERLLWIALHTVCMTNLIAVDAEPTTYRGEEVPGYGVHITPQHKVDKYRADFFVWEQTFKEDHLKWIIECDGHAYHERSKEERQREKQRDRFFTMRGYKILRYTGSEIVKDPYVVAAEILRAVCHDTEILTPKEYFGE